MKYKITKEELDAIRIYKNEKNKEINQLLTEDIETDMVLQTR